MEEFMDLGDTKSDYRNKLYEAIIIFDGLRKESPSPLFENIMAQLLDIKENIIDNENLSDSFEIDERYTLGAIATRYFEEGSELRDRLCEIFYGALYYSEFPEE